MRALPLLLLLLAGCAADGVASSDTGTDTATDSEAPLRLAPTDENGVQTFQIAVDWLGVRQTVTAFERDGYYITADDVIVGIVPIEGAPPPSNRGGTTAWTGCTIPYEIGTFTSPGADLTEIDDAVASWASTTNVQFVPRTDEGDYVVFTESEYCSSWVGMAGGPQAINVDLDPTDGGYCETAAVIHEMGHAVGLLHEQQRSDRDRTLTVNEAAFDTSVGVSFAVNFEMSGVAYGPYDLASSMQYESCSFTACGTCDAASDPETCWTMWESPDIFIPRHLGGLSPGDVGSIDAIYGGASTWYADADGDGFGDPASVDATCGAAPADYVSNAGDCDDTRDDTYPGAAETCDGTDEDCDGAIDAHAANAAIWYADVDSDGYGDAGAPAAACTVPDGYLSDATDCDDAFPDVNPGASETCDGIDEDCDGIIDEDRVCTDGLPDAAECPLDAVCAPTFPIDAAWGASVTIANVFDRPLYEAFYGSPAPSPTIRRVVTADPDDWSADPTDVLPGAWPAVTYDVSARRYVLCRAVDATLRCATSADTASWTDDIAVMSGDPELRPLRPVALVPWSDGLRLYLLGNRDGVTALYEARFDGGKTFAITASPLAGTADAPVSAATAWLEGGATQILVVSGAAARRLSWDAASGTWIPGEAPAGLEYAGWLAATTFYQQPLLWRSP